MMLTCVIHTHNSELHLRDVVRSVSWCDEILVVDMESTDGTLLIAQEMGARVVSHPFIGAVDPARQFGLEQCRGDWILALDSDEIVPAALASRLRAIAEDNAADVVDLCFRNFFFGSELKGTGWSYKDIRVPRFFKKGFLSYGKRVHDFILVSPHARRLSLIERDLAIVHFNYLDVSHFIQKLDRYTSQEAEKLPAEAKHVGARMLYQCLREVGGRFFLLGGWRDGWLGFYLAFAMAFYRLSSLAKRNTLSRVEIQKAYHTVAASVPVASKKSP